MRPLGLALSLVIGFVAFRGTSSPLARSFDSLDRAVGPAPADECEPSKTVLCNTVEAKIPSPLHSLDPPSLTSGLALSDAHQLERLMAVAFSELPVIEAVTSHFSSRLARFVVGASMAEPDEALVRAFGSGSQANTGYAGGDITTLRAVLAEGNSRERWALVYVLQKNHYADGLFDRAAAEPELARALGLNESALKRRARELQITRERVEPSSRYSNGMADWLFPPFSSWVRFDFDSPHPPALHSVLARSGADSPQAAVHGAPAAARRGPTTAPEGSFASADGGWSEQSGAMRQGVASGASSRGPAPDASVHAVAGSDSGGRCSNCSEGWLGCRRLRDGGCLGTKLRSDDPSLRPPLSRRELSYQCGSEARNASGGAADPEGGIRAQRSCRLLWQPGASCYRLLDTPIGALASFPERARRLGYVALAGVSGTTANTLQLAVLLGADESELLLLRLAMLGWLVLSNDHSVWEVLLAAETFVPPPLRIGDLPAGQPALCLLGRLLPPTLRWEGHVLRAAQAWSHVVNELRPSEAWRQLGAARRGYLGCLASAAEPESCCALSRGELRRELEGLRENGKDGAAPPM